MWPRKDLIDLLQIEHPIIQAPMAGSGTPVLAGAVSNAGGLGSLGCAAMSLDELIAATDELRANTDQPFNLNFFSHGEPEEQPEIDSQVSSQLAPAYRERGIAGPQKNTRVTYDSFNADTVSTLFNHKA